MRDPYRSFTVESLTTVVECVLGLGIFIAIVFSLHLASRLGIHWDEFFFLSRVYDFVRGGTLPVFQSFHVHFFSWLTTLPTDEIGQVVAARYCMQGLGLVSGFFVYRIGRFYISRPAALFSALCYFSYSDVLFYGAHFRADPLCVFLFLTALYISLRRPAPWLQAISVGSVMALALMFSIKSSLYVVTFLLICGIRFKNDEDKKQSLKEGLAFLVVCSVFFFLFYGYHRLMIPESPTRFFGAQTGSHFVSLKGVFEKMFLNSPFFPRSRYFLLTVQRNPLTWIAMILGIGVVIRGNFGRPQDQPNPLPLLGLIFLPATVLFYRNAWPYYYVFILPPVMIFCGIAMEYFLFRYRRGSLFHGAVAFSLIAFIMATAAIHYLMHNGDGQKVQKEMIALVHEVFPDPVFYIDRCSMVASYPQAGFFMSSWGMESYRKSGTPVFARVIKRKQPVFLIANTPALDPERSLRIKEKDRLMDEDEEALRAHYIRHWGDLWVAGKMFHFSSGREKNFVILIPGEYTVESKDEVVIDGIRFAPGNYVFLSLGRHQVSVDRIPSAVHLRIGRNLYKPESDALQVPLFQGFY